LIPRRFGLAALCLAAAWCGSPALHAGNPEDLKRSCFDRANFKLGKYWLEECVEEIFTLQPVHPAFNSIAPGTGTALGFGFNLSRRFDRFEFLPSAILAATADHSFIEGAQFVFAGPSVLSLGSTGSEPVSGEHRHGSRTVALTGVDAGIDAKASIALRIRRFEAATQNFYGLGMTSTRAGLAPYSLRRNEVGVALNNPLTFWSSIGVNIDYIQPRVGPSPDATVQIRSLYPPGAVPGLYSSNNFVRTEPYLQFRVPTRGSDFALFKVGYEFFHDLNGGAFSFHRLSAIGHSTYNLRLRESVSPSKRSGFANFICPSLRSREHCTIGTLDLTGMADIAYTSNKSQVPFYFNETLGGTDINGNDTLRGFVDYRFRGPSRVLFQAEYRHPVWGPVGFLSFYDVGKVGILPSDLSLTHMRHDIGVGFYFQAANRVVLRAYIGFGSGEGNRPNYKLPSVY
jgi:hypothetical protein